MGDELLDKDMRRSGTQMIRKERGTVVSAKADRILAVFSTPEPAARSALALHKKMKPLEKYAGSEFRARVGLYGLGNHDGDYLQGPADAAAGAKAIGLIARGHQIDD